MNFALDTVHAIHRNRSDNTFSAAILWVDMIIRAPQNQGGMQRVFSIFLVTYVTAKLLSDDELSTLYPSEPLWRKSSGLLHRLQKRLFPSWLSLCNGFACSSNSFATLREAASARGVYIGYASALSHLRNASDSNYTR